MSPAELERSVRESTADRRSRRSPCFSMRQTVCSHMAPRCDTPRLSDTKTMPVFQSHWLSPNPQQLPQVPAQNSFLVSIAEEGCVEDEIDRHRPVEGHVGAIDDLPHP